MNLIATLTMLIGLVPVVSEYVNKGFMSLFGKELQGFLALLKSWIVGVGLTMIAAYNSPEMFDNFPTGNKLLLGIIWGIVVSLCANGVFQFDKVKDFLVLIKARK